MQVTKVFLNNLYQLIVSALRIIAQKLRNVTTLTWKNGKYLTDQGFEYFGQAQHAVNTLKIPTCKNLSDRGLKGLIGCKSLEYLGIEFSPSNKPGQEGGVTDAGSKPRYFK
jgi:hypothetical protein